MEHKVRDPAYFLYRYGAMTLRSVPRPLARRLMTSIGVVAYFLFRKTRSVVERNLRQVVGQDVSGTELRSLVRRSFASYARYWSDLVHLINRVGETVDQLFDAKYLKGLDEQLASGAAVLALPHLGAWELGGLWAHQQGYTVHTVAEPASSLRLTEWFTEQRRELGLTVHPLGAETVPVLLDVLRRGGTVALIADRDVVGDGIEVTFFGAKTTMPGGPALLALRSVKPLIPCAVYHNSDDQHLPIVLPAISPHRDGHLRDDIARMTQDLAYAFEKIIARAPEQWHVFQPRWQDASESARGK